MGFRLISFRFMKAVWVDVPSVSLHQRASSNHARPQEQLRKQTGDATTWVTWTKQMTQVWWLKGEPVYQNSCRCWWFSQTHRWRWQVVHKPTSSGISRLSFCRGWTDTREGEMQGREGQIQHETWNGKVGRGGGEKREKNEFRGINQETIFIVIQSRTERK